MRVLCLICYGNLYCRHVTSHVLYELFLKDLFTCVLQVERNKSQHQMSLILPATFLVVLVS